MFDSIAEAVELELLFSDSQMNFQEFCWLMLQIHSAPSSARHGFIHDLRGALQARALMPRLAKARSSRPSPKLVEALKRCIPKGTENADCTKGSVALRPRVATRDQVRGGAKLPVRMPVPDDVDESMPSNLESDGYSGAISLGQYVPQLPST
jgi:hypothetical protein